jgi:hypothetical protein
MPPCCYIRFLGSMKVRPDGAGTTAGPTGQGWAAVVQARPGPKMHSLIVGSCPSSIATSQRLCGPVRLKQPNLCLDYSTSLAFALEVLIPM